MRASGTAEPPLQGIPGAPAPSGSNPGKHPSSPWHCRGLSRSSARGKVRCFSPQNCLRLCMGGCLGAGVVGAVWLQLLLAARWGFSVVPSHPWEGGLLLQTFRWFCPGEVVWMGDSSIPLTATTREAWLAVGDPGAAGMALRDAPKMLAESVSTSLEL